MESTLGLSQMQFPALPGPEMVNREGSNTDSNPTNTVISDGVAHPSRWRLKPWQGSLEFSFLSLQIIPVVHPTWKWMWLCPLFSKAISLMYTYNWTYRIFSSKRPRRLFWTWLADQALIDFCCLFEPRVYESFYSLFLELKNISWLHLSLLKLEYKFLWGLIFVRIYVEKPAFIRDPAFNRENTQITCCA